MRQKQHNQTWITLTLSFHAYILLYTRCHFEELTFQTFRHAHYFIIKLDIQWISLSHIVQIHTSTHEKLSKSRSGTNIMNHVDQL